MARRLRGIEVDDLMGITPEGACIVLEEAGEREEFFDELTAEQVLLLTR